MSSSSAALSTTGATPATGIAVLAKDISDTMVFAAIAGTFTGVTLKFMGTLDGTNYFPVQAIDLKNGSVVNGTLSVTDSTAAGWRILCDGLLNVELYIVAIGSGTVNVVGQSGHFVNLPATSIQQTGTVIGGAQTMTGDLTLSDVNLVFGTATGTKIGTATTQKLAFWNATPVVQIANSVDYVTMLTTLGLRASGGTAGATFPGAVTGLSFLASGTAGVGYATGAGGTVSQASSRTTGVTLSKTSGTITLVSAAGSATPATFTVTNTLVAATDTVIVSQKSGTDAYSATVSAVGAGSYNITITDLTGTTTEAPAFNAVVIKGVAA